VDPKDKTHRSDVTTPERGTTVPRLLKAEVQIYRSSNSSANLAGFWSSKCRVRSRRIINMHSGRVKTSLIVINAFLHINKVSSCHTNKVPSSILMWISGILIWIRFTNERHLPTMKTINLPGLARQ